MAVEEVGIRLALQQRRQTVAGLREVKGGLDDVASAGNQVADSGAAAARGLDRATDRRYARGFAAITGGAGSLASSLGRGLLGATRVVASGFGLAAVAAGGLGLASTNLAGNAAETASAFNTVFGPAARGVQKDLDGLTNRFGLYNPELQDAARQFGVFGKAAGVAGKDLPGFSTKLVKAGLDLGSFYNQDPTAVFEALQSGLSGESEPLRQFGIFLSDASLNAYAAAEGIGKTTKEMSDQEKVALRQAFILANLGDAQGDLARTSEGYANQQRKAGGQTQTFLKMLGGPLMTAGTGAFRGFNAIAKQGIGMLEDRLPSLEKRAGGVSRALERWGRQMSKELPTAIGTLSATWDTWSGKLAAFRAEGGSGELDQLGANVERLGPGLAAVGDELPGLADLLSVTNTVTGFLADHTDDLSKAMPYLVAGYVGLKVSQLAANIVLAASLPLKVAELFSNRALAKSNRELVASRGGVVVATVAETAATAANTGAQNAGILARGRAVVGMVAQRAAMVAGAVATGVITAAQWLWNAALTANPIGIVIVAIAAMAAGVYALWTRSETFRAAIDVLWNSVLKPFGAWLGGVLKGALLGIASAMLSMGRFGLKAFTWLVKAAFMTFDGILAAAEKGLGWVPGLGDKIRGARAGFDDFGNSAISKLEQLDEKLRTSQEAVDRLARPREAVITVTVQRRLAAAGNVLTAGAAEVAAAATPGPSRRAAPAAEFTIPDPAGASFDFGDDDAAAGAAGGLGGPGRELVVPVVIDGREVGRASIGHIKGTLARR